jgi:hypothetical protein
MNRIAVSIFGNSLLLVLALVGSLVPTRSIQAHVELGSPNGGETLVGNSTSMIEWMPRVGMHDTQDFELWYSTVGESGPWTIIAQNLPPGSLAIDSLHTYAWAVPNITDSSAWVRVRQNNNVDADYEDVSDGSFSIAAALLQGDYNLSGQVDAGDYTVWRNSLGRTGAGLAADGNGDSRVDAGDYGVWKTNFGESPGNGAIGAAAVPEPASCVLLVGMVVSCLVRSRLSNAAHQSGQQR